MSLPLDIDELTDKQLRAELLRRKNLRDAGFCDYCGAARGTPVCKFPDRHLGNSQHEVAVTSKPPRGPGW